MQLEDDEPVDHKPIEEEKCKPKCQKFLELYEACVERISGDETGEAHCTVSIRCARSLIRSHAPVDWDNDHGCVEIMND